MATRTTHVIPAKLNGHWLVKKAGGKRSVVFDSRKEATRVAKLSMRGKAGQVVIFTKGGKILPVKVVGMPKLQRSYGTGKLTPKAIEKAVSKVVLERLVAADPNA